MTGRPRVPGLNDEWAASQLALDLAAAMDAVEAAPARPDPPVCPRCTLVADTLGGPVFACESVPGCALDRALAEHGAVDGDLQPLPPVCGSCTAAPGQPGAWDCDPDRPGCPLHEVPEQSRCHQDPGCTGGHR